MDEAVRTALLELVDVEGGSLATLARRSRELAQGTEYDEVTTAQFVHGFAEIVREAADGDERDVRDLYTASAAGVVRSEGRTAGSLARSLVTFALLLGEEIATSVPPETRAGVAEWLARFLGEWSEELLDAAEGEEP